MLLGTIAPNAKVEFSKQIKCERVIVNFYIKYQIQLHILNII